jgi:hypothetical protein
VIGWSRHKNPRYNVAIGREDRPVMLRGRDDEEGNDNGAE